MKELHGDPACCQYSTVVARGSEEISRGKIWALEQLKEGMGVGVGDRSQENVEIEGR